jgi:hypothetical protein
VLPLTNPAWRRLLGPGGRRNPVPVGARRVASERGTPTELLAKAGSASIRRIGIARSSQRGSHQFARPSSSIVAHEQHPHEGGVDEDGHRQAQADHLDDPLVAEDERQEQRDHDRRRSGDDPSRRRQAPATALLLSPLRWYSSRIRDSRKTS